MTLHSDEPVGFLVTVRVRGAVRKSLRSNRSKSVVKDSNDPLAQCVALDPGTRKLRAV